MSSDHNRIKAEINDGNMTYQNVWGAAKAGLRGKYIAIHTYI